MTPIEEWRLAFGSLPDETISERNLIFEIHAEISDPDYLNYRHGTRHTRNKGCVGPLCRKALRDWQRDRLARSHAERGTIPRPHARSKEMVRVDALLGPIKAAHDKEYDSRRLYTSEELQAAELMNQLVA